MKHSVMAMIIFCLSILATAGSQAQTAPPSEAETVNKRLMSELRRLRLEVIEQKMEFQQWKIRQIERELQQAQAEQQRLEGEERAIHQELAELSGAAEGKEELESLKSELAGDRTRRLRDKQQPVHQRVSELTGQLNQEEARRRELLKQAGKLKAEISAEAN